MNMQQTTRTPGEQRSLERLTIGRLARLSGINAKAIRYYESVGVLPSPHRQENGYRYYSQVDVNRLILHRCLRLLGVPLETLKSVLLEASDARCADIQQEVLQLVGERIRAIEQEIRELFLLRDQLECNYQQLLVCHHDDLESFRDWRVSCLPGRDASGTHTPEDEPMCNHQTSRQENDSSKKEPR
jgi:MerR family copper efflux transcriptional regulator